MICDRWHGRDLSGSLEGAGGIGGLLAMQDTNGTTTGENPEDDDLRYVYHYDANGNVGQVIDLAHDPNDPAGAIKAHYEYDAYGNVLVQSGAYAAANSYRFSTKPWDDETGLGYWGQRYYDPRLGRWTNHDPIGIRGSLNLYRYARNSATSIFDSLGLRDQCPPGQYYHPDFGCVRYLVPVPPIPPDGPGLPPGPAQPPTQDPPPRRPNNPNAPTNGCSVPGWVPVPGGDPDNPGGFPFGPACNAHDQCYATPGKTQEECDEEFLQDLLAICAAQPEDQQAQCENLAHAYAAAVQRF
jgi:RHS repeat-associated protein